MRAKSCLNSFWWRIRRASSSWRGSIADVCMCGTGQEVQRIDVENWAGRSTFQNPSAKKVRPDGRLSFAL